MWQTNPTWGAPRIVGELRKLGIDVAKSTVETYRMRRRKPPSPTWKAFLQQTASKFPLRWWIINSIVGAGVGSTSLQGLIAAG